MSLTIQITFFLMVFVGLILLLVTRNLIYAAYSLAVVLISLAGIYVFLNAELLAVVQLLLYAGGVVVLLLFGVMMTNRLKGNKLLSESSNVIPSAIIAIGIFGVLSYLFSHVEIEMPRDQISEQNQVESMGISFLTEHIVAFELIAFILLVALVGSAYLAKMSANE